MTVLWFVLQLVSLALMWRYHHSARAEEREINRSETEPCASS